MKAFKMLAAVVAAVVIVACGQKAESTEVKFSKIENFFVRNDVPLENAENYFVINNSDEFFSVFGMARTMNNTIEDIDFSKYLVAAVVVQPSNKEIDVNIDAVQKQGDDLRIDYSLKYGEDRSYTATQFVAVKIEKMGYKNIDFKKQK